MPTCRSPVCRAYLVVEVRVQAQAQARARARGKLRGCMSAAAQSRLPFRRVSLFYDKNIISQFKNHHFSIENPRFSLENPRLSPYIPGIDPANTSISTINSRCAWPPPHVELQSVQFPSKKPLFLIQNSSFLMQNSSFSIQKAAPIHPHNQSAPRNHIVTLPIHRSTRTCTQNQPQYPIPQRIH